MLLAERAENERLRQIIKELQRHRFGRRAESLPEDQLLLGLEEAEQVEAAGQAETEEQRAGRAQSARRQAPGEPRRAAGASAADRDGGRYRRARSARAVAATLHRIGEDVVASASTSCRLSSGCWSCAGPNTPAGPARTWWCRRRRRRG